MITPINVKLQLLKAGGIYIYFETVSELDRESKLTGFTWGQKEGG